jgi:hypothetical protein
LFLFIVKIFAFIKSFDGHGPTPRPNCAPPLLYGLFYIPQKKMLKNVLFWLLIFQILSQEKKGKKEEDRYRKGYR